MARLRWRAVALSLAAGGVFTTIRHAVNWVTQPALFISLSIGVFILMFVFYKWWTKPAVFAVIFIGFLAAYFGSMGDPNYKSIVAKPDNVPITIMVTASSTSVNPASAGRVRRGALRTSVGREVIRLYVVLIGVRLLVGVRARRARGVAHEGESTG